MNTNTDTGKTTVPDESQTTTPTGGAGITGAVIGNLASPKNIGIIVVIAAVLIGGIVLVTRMSKKKTK